MKQLHNEDPLTISIGTGKDLKKGPNPTDYSSEFIHQKLLDTTRDHAEYFRLNVEHGLGKMKFDEWKGERGNKTLQHIRTRTEEYLKSPDGEAIIAASAMRLVEIRRDRSDWQPDLDHWDRFCYGVEYACPVHNCTSVEVGNRTRQDLRDHLERTHQIEPDRLESLLDEGRCFPLDKPH